MLLGQIGIDYDSVVCWHRIDSILAYKYPTSILIGEPYSPKDGRYSGTGVKHELASYLSELIGTSEIKILFPDFGSDGFRALNAQGQVEWWENAMFYHRPLGRIVAELNYLKLKVVQLEILNAERKTTR